MGFFSAYIVAVNCDPVSPGTPSTQNLLEISPIGANAAVDATTCLVLLGDITTAVQAETVKLNRPVCA